MDSKTHMYKDFLGIADHYVGRFIQQADEDTDLFTRGIAGIIGSRMRVFVRTMNEQDILKLLSEMNSLKKIKIKEKRKIAKAIMVFANF